MRFRIRFAQQIVGAFVLLAILGTASLLILLGLNQRWFAKNYFFWSTFTSANGLSVGMPITLRGFEIGKVSSISLTRDNNVEVLFYIYDTYYQKALPNSVLELASSALPIGGGGLLFHPGRGFSTPLPERSYIPSTQTEAGRVLVAQGLADRPKTEDVLGSVIAQVGPVLADVETTLNSIRGVVDSLQSSLKGQGEGPLTVVLNNLTATTAQLNGVLARVDGVAANIQHLTEGMTDPTGLAKKLLDPKGSIATILDDDNRLYNEIVQAIEELNGIITQLNEFTRFVNSTQPQISGILEKGRETLDQGKDVLEAVKNNPLLRGGIAAKREQPTTFQGYRDEDF
jgi:phospholipid/cholesterol/gamma-HCH transport system substrate-binding protein